MGLLQLDQSIDRFFDVDPRACDEGAGQLVLSLIVFAFDFAAQCHHQILLSLLGVGSLPEASQSIQIEQETFRPTER
jgi:hypothetical protein